MNLSRLNVSVVIPTYNRSRYLREAVRSALDQSLTPLEVIVVDHASTDDTPDVIRSFGCEVKSLRLEVQGRGGVGTARNAGLAEARGSLVAFLDDDDAWTDTKLEEQVDRFLHQAGLVLSCTDARVIGPSREVLKESYFGYDARPERLTLRKLARDTRVIVSSVVARLDAIRELGGFSVDPSFFMVEDYLLWLRLRQKGSFDFLDRPLTLYRLHAASLGKTDHLSAARLRRRVLTAVLSEDLPLTDRIGLVAALMRENWRVARLRIRHEGIQ